MNSELYWLWISNLKGIGQKKRSILLEAFGTLDKAFAASDAEIKELLESYSCFSSKDIEVFLSSRNPEKILAYSNKLKNNGISYISLEHMKYPSRLKHIYDPPCILYYRGELPKQETIKIAVVGARKCSSYGREAAKYFAKELANKNVLVVSGMARGIDTAAHLGALDADGKTLAILGCGVNVCYPKENYKLMSQIIEKGCVMSETPVNAAPIPGNFPMRNRIISGICDGVLIVEAASKSGSLITADSALEQGKDVFAVPGRIFDNFSEGSNQLIKMGAKIVTNIDDILEEYIEISQKNCIQEDFTKIILEKDEQIVYSCISLEPIYIDVIIERTHLNIDDLQYALIKLELKGLIEQLSNKYFIKKV